MNRDFELAFISRDALNIHLDYLNSLKLKYSILVKSYPALANADIGDIKRIRLDEGAAGRAADLMSEIKSHECYFNSFCKDPQPYKAIKKYFSSESAFVYEIFVASRDTKKAFIYVYKNKYGVPYVTEKYCGAPIFAVDLSEHAYFLDYGFSRDEYVRRALGYLDLKKLSLEPLDNARKK